MILYCNNDPCETEATRFYDSPRGVRIHLCTTCAEAFEWGQVSPEAILYHLDYQDGEDEDA